VPYYICDAALQPFEAAGVDVEFYAIDDVFDPVLPPSAPGTDECLLYVNYFGLKTSTALSLIARHPARVVVDDTQAFFSKGYDGGWSFNSARKFFGVPDGGYAYGPELPAIDRPRVPDVHYAHLVNRLLGQQELAYQQYCQSELAVTADVWRMSVLSERLLDQIDYRTARECRRRNFAWLHDALGGCNGLKPLMPDDAAVPFCYPMLSTTSVPWTAIWDRCVFVPRLWPDVSMRPLSARFERELTLAERVLPLPIDHRYAPDDLARLVEVLAEIVRW
jgi:hypothetical protein